MTKTTDHDAEELLSRIVTCIREVVRSSSPTPLHEPCWGGEEWRYLKECLDSGFVSSIGPFVDQFEKELAHYTGARHAVAVVNGTSALHVALKLAGVSPDDEVIVPAMTFVATANAVTYCGAIPHFADISAATLGIDPEGLREHLQKTTTTNSAGTTINRQTGKRVKAAIVVHSFGHPAEITKILAICQEFGLELIEDAAESLGSLYEGRHTGTFGRLGVLSFNGNKIITTGGGGAILTNDSDLARQAKHVTTTAKLPHPWRFFHDQIGYNYRMPNINAALGLAQLKQLPHFVALKRELAQRYITAFEKEQKLTIFREPPATRSNYWLNTLLLDSSLANMRDRLLEYGHQSGIGLRPAWELLPTLPMYQRCPSMDLTNASRITARLINLPSSVTLMRKDISFHLPRQT